MISTSEEVRDLLIGGFVRRPATCSAGAASSWPGGWTPDAGSAAAARGLGVRPMRFVDEYRDPAAARALVARITELAGDDQFKFMEVCGGHTHTIYRHGIEHVLPASVELVHGPGCPVCVIPMGRVDDAIAVAERAGRDLHLLRRHDAGPRQPTATCCTAKAEGADVRFVYSPLDALRIAVEQPRPRVSCSSPWASRPPPRRPP